MTLNLLLHLIFSPIFLPDETVPTIALFCLLEIDISVDLFKLYHELFNNDRGLSLDDKTKDYFDRNTGGQVNSLHEVTQLG